MLKMVEEVRLSNYPLKFLFSKMETLSGLDFVGPIFCLRQFNDVEIILSTTFFFFMEVKAYFP
jgi:hypothetical protein